MAMLTVSHLSDEMHSALQMRAAQHKYSTETEVREVLMSVVKSEAASKWRKFSRN